MDIIKSIRVWVRNRNIHTAHPRDQYLKVVEEVGELAAALARANAELIKDSIGDIVVTLVSLCETMDIDFNECVYQAYDEIKDRKGKLVDGVFIKEEERMITREEYEFLKKLKTEGFNWIARDKNWKLFIYQEMPRRSSTIWNFGGGIVNIQEERFAFVKWEDEKPTKIDDLIRDYESHKVIVGEKVKVTIPHYVADWIEDRKRRYTLASLFTLRYMPEDVCRWIAFNNENCEKMALAWIYGYEVDGEKLYTVRLANGDYLYRFVSVGIDWVKGVDYKNDPDFHLTQAEIESVDPVLMKIAEEVE